MNDKSQNLETLVAEPADNFTKGSFTLFYASNLDDLEVELAKVVGEHGYKKSHFMRVVHDSKKYEISVAQFKELLTHLTPVEE